MTFQPQTMSPLGYPKVIPYTKLKFEHFGIIRLLSHAADKQTDSQIHKQTNENPTNADRHRCVMAHCRQ